MAIPALDNAIQAAAESASLPPDLLKIAACLLLSYPFSAILKRLPDKHKNLKDVYCIGVSLFYLVGIFSLWTGIRTLLISSLGTYLITKYFSTPLMPWINFLFLMGHLFSSHIKSQLFVEDYDTNAIDITGAQMVLCMKLSAFGWNVADGWLPDAKLSGFQRDRAIRQLPNLLDYLAYVFYFPSILTGPSYDYAEFQQWIDLSMFDVTINDPVKGKRKKRTIPRSGRVAAKKCAQGIAWIVLWTQISKYFTLEHALSTEFGKEFVVKQMFYLWVLGFTYRLKYYGAWMIAEGACILSGLGFNGKTETGEYKWNRVQNVDPITFETGQNAHVLLEAWNMNTNKWLKNYVYLRVTPRGRKPGFVSTFLTFFTSALWHGTQPGYYLTFILGAFYQSIGKLFRRNIRPIFMESDGVTPGKYKPYYDIVTYFVTQIGFGYAVQPFVVLNLKRSLQLWGNVSYFGHVFVLLTLFIFIGPFKKQVISKLHSYYPKPLTEAEKIQLDTVKLRAIKREIEELASRQPVLGLPQDEIDNLELDVKDAIEEFNAMRDELVKDLNASKRRGSFIGGIKPDSIMTSDAVEKLKEAKEDTETAIEQAVEEVKKTK